MDKPPALLLARGCCCASFGLLLLLPIDFIAKILAAGRGRDWGSDWPGWV